MSIQITDKGAVVTTPAENLEQVRQNWREALGNALNLAHDTPQGQLMASEAAILTDKDSVFLQFMNQINPSIASGVMQDALAAIYFLSRRPALPTYVELECTGLEGTYIPGRYDVSGGALAKSAGGDIFVCSVGGTMPASGRISLQFESMETGPVAAPPDSINRIYKAIPGWDACNNPESGIVGRQAESRGDFEARRRQSVAKNATGSVAAVYANVANADGVTDCRVYENTGWETKSIDGVAIGPKSIYVSVAGGEDGEIARLIYSRKSASAGTTGDTAVVVRDGASGAEYTVNFQRPAPLAFKVQVSALGATAPADAVRLIQTAVYENFNGTDGSRRAGIGDTVYASRFYAPIGELGISAVSIKVAAGNGAWADYASCRIDQIPALDPADIEVTLI